MAEIFPIDFTAPPTLAEGRLADWLVTLIIVCVAVTAGVWLWRNG